MKKIITISIILTMSAMLFAGVKVSKKNQGTYIPLSMYETVQKSKSYSEGISACAEEDMYTVLGVKENEVLSNDKFHDAFKLKDSEIDFAFKTKKGKTYLTDKKTKIEYIKISDSTDYYSAFDQFLSDNILKEISKGNSNVMVEDGKAIFNGYAWEIDKDQWHYSSGIDLILYSVEAGAYIGFADGKIFTLKDGEDLLKVLDVEIE